MFFSLTFGLGFVRKCWLVFDGITGLFVFVLFILSEMLLFDKEIFQLQVPGAFGLGIFKWERG